MRLALQAGAIAARQQFTHALKLRTGLGKEERQCLKGRFPPDILNQPVENGWFEIGYGLAWQNFSHQSGEIVLAASRRTGID